jgi:hypothetical protein
MVRHGKGGKRREVGMDRWAWEHLDHGSSFAPICASERCSASCAARRAVDRARQPESAASSAPPPRQPESGAGLRRTSCDTRTRSRCPARGSRCWSSSDSSVMQTSGSPRPISAGSTTPRSSIPSTNDPHP